MTSQLASIMESLTKGSPLVPILGIGLLATATFGVRRLVHDGRLSHLGARVAYASIALFSLWGLASAVIAVEGLYLKYSTVFLVGWGTFVPAALLLVPLVVSRKWRRGLSAVASALPIEWLTNIHAVRILGVGAISKYVQGVLPGHFILPIGVPDFLFGLSALLMGYLARTRRETSHKALFAWHFLGAAMFLPAIPLLHLSVPSPVQIFTTGATTAEVLSYPMALVPTVIVPFYLLAHGLAIWKIIGQTSVAVEAGELPSSLSRPDESPEHVPASGSLAAPV